MQHLLREGNAFKGVCQSFCSGERGMSGGGYVETWDLGYPPPLPQLSTPSGGHQTGRQASKVEEINIL